jgi:MoaA/NifB/PqqE/SkfB family radical SAM enzyme
MHNFHILKNLFLQSMKVKYVSGRAPVFVSIVLNGRCNLRCSYCYANVNNRFDNLHPEGFSKQEIFSMVDELYRMGTRLIFLLGGEPLLHEHIGEIVEHIVGKGIMLHIITNGTLIKKKLDRIKKAHYLCVSLDGPQEYNDRYRGKGTYKVIIDNIKAALAENLHVRIHPVLTKGSIDILPDLIKVCQELKILMTYSPANYLGETDFPDFKITDAEYKEFWLELIRMKKRGAPIANSLYALRKVVDWPIGYHAFITGEQAKRCNYTPVFCASGYTYCGIDSSGIMCNCINLGVKNGLNVRDVGIKKAWDYLPEIRRNTGCVSCAALNTVETSVYMNLAPTIWWDAVRYHLQFFR